MYYVQYNVIQRDGMTLVKYKTVSRNETDDATITRVMVEGDYRGGLKVNIHRGSPCGVVGIIP